MDSDRELKIRKTVTSINWLKGSTADLRNLRRYACKAMHTFRQLLEFVRNILKATMS
jgi:hypothetical protein